MLTSEQLRNVLNDLIEDLASVEHERWSHWQSYVHSKGIRQADGALLLPEPLVSHWERQMRLEYKDLTSEEKEADRAQVRRYLPIIEKELQGAADANGK